jgi:hypothetical protein
METKISKISSVILITAAIVWLGGLNIRAMVGFDMLQMGTLDFKPNIHPYVERTVFSLVAQSSIVIDIAYGIVWLVGILWLKTTKLSVRKNGWLMMSAILFYMFTPVEIYTIILDLKMWYLDFLGSNDLVEFRKLFIHRLGALSGVPMIAILSYYTIIVLAIFRPLQYNLTSEKPDDK